MGIPRYVYMLSTYDEHGAENCHATIDRTKIESMLKHYAYEDGASDMNVSGLRVLLKQDDAVLVKTGERAGGHDLTGRWGSIQLHVITLE